MKKTKTKKLWLVLWRVQEDTGWLVDTFLGAGVFDDAEEANTYAKGEMSRTGYEHIIRPVSVEVPR